MFSKLCRVGNQPELRYTQSEKAVMSLSLAYNYGRKGDDGKRPTQWIEAVLWGNQAESLKPYINKGDQVSVSIDDLHIETYEGKNGTGHKLTGRIVAFDFAGSKPSGEPRQQPAPSSGGGFDDMDDTPF